MRPGAKRRDHSVAPTILSSAVCTLSMRPGAKRRDQPFGQQYLAPDCGLASMRPDANRRDHVLDDGQGSAPADLASMRPGANRRDHSARPTPEGAAEPDTILVSALEHSQLTGGPAASWCGPCRAARRVAGGGALAAVPLERYARQRHCAPGRGARFPQRRPGPALLRPGANRHPAHVRRSVDQGRVQASMRPGANRRPYGQPPMCSYLRTTSERPRPSRSISRSCRGGARANRGGSR